MTSNGRITDSNDLLQSGVVYRVEPRLCGGKGGNEMFQEHINTTFPSPISNLPINVLVLNFFFVCFVGFGSMLRALGAQIEKTTNREACRDLSGRRLRDVNHEKQ